MNSLWGAILAEFQKIRRHQIVWISFAAFALAPLMGGIFILILSKPELSAESILSAKILLMSFGANWKSYLSILSQAVGVGGVLIFGFVASWVFGREYSDGTMKDLLALPVSRTQIVNAKFITYIIWCLALAASNLFLGFLIGAVLGLPGSPSQKVLTLYGVTTLLTIPLGAVVSLFAVYGRGYLAPLGFVAVTLVLAQVVAATGFGFYFPWSVPGLYSGAGGAFKNQLDLWSYLTVVGMGVAGYVATVLWLKLADHSK